MRTSIPCLAASSVARRIALPGAILFIGFVSAAMVALSRPAPAQCWDRAANGVMVGNACAVQAASSPCVYNDCWWININCTCSPSDANNPNAVVLAIKVTNPPSEWRTCVSGNFGPGANCGMDKIPCGGTTISPGDSTVLYGGT